MILKKILERTYILEFIILTVKMQKIKEVKIPESFIIYKIRDCTFYGHNCGKNEIINRKI